MGNRSSGSAPSGVRRSFVLLPGFFVSGRICIPRAPPHALWLLAWVEQLLQESTHPRLEPCPPWPTPTDPLVVRQLRRELLDLRWAVPDWSTGRLVVDPALTARYRTEGREGLARELFDVQVLPGEWWMDGVGGVLLSRTTSNQFDWDFRRRADFRLEIAGEAQSLLNATEHDLTDLMRKLGSIEPDVPSRDRAFLGAPLRVGGRKDLFFPLYGEEERILPDELAELEPALRQHAPELFGQRKALRPRLVRVPRSPIERFVAELAISVLTSGFCWG